MEARVICGKCGAEYRVADRKLGKAKLAFKCKKCEQRIHINPGTDGFVVEGGALKIPFNVDSLPSSLGKFAKLERIATGGMGDVFKAVMAGAEGFERTVALKVLHPHLARDESFAKAMVDEAKITVMLHHPNIVQMYNLERQGNLIYCVMEYVPGKSLSKIQKAYRKKKARIPLEMALYIIMQTLDGLAYAHEMKGPDGEPLNIVHRDISPQNILVTQDGWVKIIDFGIAKAASRITQTMPGIIKGKFAYMAPEQLKGKVDHRADIFATGVVLWETLSGARLFHSTTDVDTLHKVLHFEPPPLELPDKEMARKLDRILQKAMHKEPDKRYQSAREFKRALAELVAPATVDDLREKVDIDATNAQPDEALAASDAATGDVTPVVESASLHPRTSQSKLRRLPVAVAMLVLLGLVAAGGWYVLNQAERSTGTDAGLAKDVGPVAAGGEAAAVQDGGVSADGKGAAVASRDGGMVQEKKLVARVTKKPPVKPRRVKLSRKLVEKVIMRYGGRLQQCANKHLTKIRPGGQVAFKLRFTVLASGKVSAADIIPADVGRSEFGKCITSQVKKMRFPAHKDPSVTVTFPLMFRAQ